MFLESALLGAILIAGFYMAWNMGASDVANAMGTSVGSGALTLRRALVVAAALEFCGAFFFGSHVSSTIQEGILNIGVYQEQPLTVVYGMLAALLAAGAWLQIASYFGWPVSTTHSIVGAIIGFALASGGVHAVQWPTVFFIGSSWVLSPILGGLFAFIAFSAMRRFIFYSASPLQTAKKIFPYIVFSIAILLEQVVLAHSALEIENGSSIWGILIALAIAYVSHLAVRGLSVKPISCDVVDTDQLSAMQIVSQHVVSSTGSDVAMEGELAFATIHAEYEAVESLFSYLQIVSACLMAFAHGANDVANSVGPLSAAVAILQQGTVTVSMQVPTWALLLGASGIVIGLATWGWRVIETIGTKITELTPSRGFAVEFSAAAISLVASRMGMPISTTHTLVGAIIGVGAARGLGAIDLGIARDIATSWFVTIPAGALLSIFFFHLISIVG